MLTQPTLETDRLILRPLSPADAPTIQKKVSDWAIAPAARYITPYEEAYRLLLEIEEHGYPPPYSRHALEPLSDTQIQAMLPHLRQYKAAISEPSQSQESEENNLNSSNWETNHN